MRAQVDPGQPDGRGEDTAATIAAVVRARPGSVRVSTTAIATHANAYAACAVG